MIKVEIQKPIWHDRSISINKATIDRAYKDREMILVKINANPYKDNNYIIDPAKILAIGKSWFIKGVELLNFSITEMEVQKNV
jgi:hypothetical protein